ncbi:protein dpy-30 homolog [Perca fluviatilis]|uniref:protein dpy-30 homolog n=1 Tax=Perca fluviatilis TaxID=8168 RepID=UPI0019667B40|nr:protein dpy-30 homolog [Perca fluviatilis]
MADDHTDADHSMEGHTPVSENPHAEYLTENIQGDLPPPNPIEYLAAFLLKNKAQFEERS